MHQKCRSSSGVPNEREGYILHLAGDLISSRLTITGVSNKQRVPIIVRQYMPELSEKHGILIISFNYSHINLKTYVVENFLQKITNNFSKFLLVHFLIYQNKS